MEAYYWQWSCCLTVTAKDTLNTRDTFYPEFVAGQSLILATSATPAIWNQKRNLEETSNTCCLKLLFSKTLKCLFNFKDAWTMLTTY